MKLSPRHEPVTRARIAIAESVIAAVKNNGLTYAELVGIMLGILEGWTKGEIREERQQ